MAEGSVPVLPASSPRRGRLFAVGDIHGCIAELECLLEAIRPGPEDKLVFIGDYVDRGPDPQAVIDRLLKLRESSGASCVFLKGNHEDMFLAYLGEKGRYGDAFLLNGGRTTLASYGLSLEDRGPSVLDALPPAHVSFLQSLQLYDQDPPFLFVHAGVAPLRKLEEQEEEDLLWIREEFIRNRHPLPFTVVFGHTPQRDVLWHLPYKIGIDTGCVYGNKLSCIDLSDARLLQVERDSGRVTQCDISKELGALESLKESKNRV